MAETTNLRDPILVAIWPGMGSVALVAGDYLLQQLRARRIADLDAKDYFDIQSVDVSNGIATVSRPPRNMFFEWKDPGEQHDLLIFVGEAQPSSRGYALCQKVIAYAAGRGVKEVFTFAAMATQLEPGTTPRAFAVATDQPTLATISEHGAEPLEGGQISGLNGVLLAAAAQNGLHGTCLLGELPYFAVAVPNPGAAHAVLERFTQLIGAKIDLAPLQRQAKAVDEKIKEMLERLQQEAARDSSSEESGEQAESASSDESAEARHTKKARVLDPASQQKIDHLFEKARQDRTKAVELKQELDRLGVFKQYEDRFLDLFRNAA